MALFAAAPRDLEPRAAQTKAHEARDTQTRGAESRSPVPAQSTGGKLLLTDLHMQASAVRSRPPHHTPDGNRLISRMAPERTARTEAASPEWKHI